MNKETPINLKHSPYCELMTAVRRSGCCCGANQRIREALAVGLINAGNVVESCSGGEYEDWDND